MAGRYHYSSTSDTKLAKEIMAGCCELYLQLWEYEGKGTINLNAGGYDSVKLVDSGACEDDKYNSGKADNFYIHDDNGALTRGKIADTRYETDGCVLLFEADDLVLVSDGETAPTLTDDTEYDVVVLSGSNENMFGDYFGYTDDSVEFDSTPETEALEICNIEGQMEEVAENVTKRALVVNGATYNVPNSDILKNVMNLETYGLNTANHKEFHGGFSPNIKKYFQLTALTKDHDDNYIAVQLFKVQLLNNGAWSLGGTGWKIIPFTAKGKKDLLRDSGLVNGFRILIWN